MKALVLVDHPENKIQLLEVEKPVPTEGKVLIKLKAAALNRRDQWIREGKYPNIQMNTILGSDGAGIVEEVSAGVSSDLIGNHQSKYRLGRKPKGTVESIPHIRNAD